MKHFWRTSGGFAPVPDLWPGALLLTGPCWDSVSRHPLQARATALAMWPCRFPDIAG